MSDKELIRLSKRLSELGLCSRREADDFIQRRLVRVEGQIVDTLGFKVTRDQKVELTKEAKKQMSESVTILVNKPIGYVSSQPEKGYEPAIELITDENRDQNFPGRNLKNSDFENLAVAGRLDIDSQGLLILTQDGRVAKLLIGENSNIEKEYLVRVRGKLSEKDLELLRFGLELDGRPLKRAHVEWINADQLRFVLKEGRKRQIRRMCEAVGLQVIGLKRVRIGRVRLGQLSEGQWRFLLPRERF